MLGLVKSLWSFSLLILFVGSSLTSNKLYFNTSLPPVVIVPGDGGSQMEARLNKSSVVHYLCTKKTDYWFAFWLNIELLAPLVLDCFVDNMRLVYDNKTRATFNSPGVETRINGFGNTSGVEYLDESQLSITTYFHEIVVEMVKWGYVRGRSVRAAPFDFRRSANEMSDYFIQLKKLIEETYAMNGNKKVVIIPHSMGNIVALYFLNKIVNQAWKDKYVKTMITLAGPWGGASKLVRLMASGDNLGVFVVNPLVARTQQRTMSSTAWMLPSTKFWKKDEILVFTPHRNYTVHDYEQFFTDLNFKTGWEMRKDTMNLIHDLTPPGVEVHCIHGNGLKTPGQFRYTTGMWPDKQPYMIPDDGDGTVNMRSLLGCLLWRGKQKYPVYHQVFPNAEHMKMLKVPAIIAYIKKVLTGL
ncbi:lysosomal phospholipase A and acyltransferase-like [Tubulanus polymorphus]|uniref:lysosomal phospholipase A and acyltransferase-like n=1 Tax=Tubulanus polymorphus TaxID=672921 RepID=UPI003DA32CF0